MSRSNKPYGDEASTSSCTFTQGRSSPPSRPLAPPGRTPGRRRPRRCPSGSPPRPGRPPRSSQGTPLHVLRIEDETQVKDFGVVAVIVVPEGGPRTDRRPLSRRRMKPSCPRRQHTRWPKGGASSSRAPRRSPPADLLLSSFGPCRGRRPTERRRVGGLVPSAVRRLRHRYHQNLSMPSSFSRSTHRERTSVRV